VGRVSSTPPASSTIQRPSRPPHCSQVTTAARPELTITEAAKATGVDRRTISRRLNADAFPNAHRDVGRQGQPESGPWLIPVTDLIGAKLRVHQPAGPDLPATPDPGTVHRAIVAALSATASAPLVVPWWLTGAGSLLPMATITDPYRALARADLIDRISNGNNRDWWNMTTYPELGDRTATEAWQAGDHAAVELLIDKWYAEAEAHAERRRNDPKFMAMIERRSEELDAKRAEADKHRRSA
jgi:hypothetical protein